MLSPALNSDAVLIVDDAPTDLALLHNVLQKAGYTVRVATSGCDALDSARCVAPDMIMLDAVMPGVDGFETCRRLKDDVSTRDIPIIFLTALNDSEHVVQAFQAGGVDYVSKPVSPPEVLARVASHLHHARLVMQTRLAVDAAGRAVVSIDAERCVVWATPLARRWLQSVVEPEERLPVPLRRWLDSPDAQRTPFTLWVEGERLIFNRLDDSLLLMQRQSTMPEPEALQRNLRLTCREAQILYWVALGKTNREIADVLDISPRTVNKHLEHVFEKLNVETRTAAATVALSKGEG